MGSKSVHWVIESCGQLDLPVLGRRLACPSGGADVVAGGRLGVADAQSGLEVMARWVDVGSVHGRVQHVPGVGALGTPNTRI